jgi:SAM-dependent methyltransferase
VSPEAPRCEPLDACPVCRAPGTRERFSSPDLQLSVPGTFRYVECTTCGTVYQDPRVREDDLASCYPAGYFTREGAAWVPAPAPAGSVRDRLRRAIRRAADGVPDRTLSAPLRLAGSALALSPSLRRRARFGLVDGLEPPVGRRGRCLEVGPGQGVDLFCLRALGWEAHGLEVDPVAAARARETSGCEVTVGTLDTAEYAPGSFDLVYMSHVLEHLPDPGRALRRCFELLAPTGRLVLVHPNPGALTVRIFGRSSCVFEPPRHLVLPAGAAAVALLRSLGFADARAATSARHAASYFAASRVQRAGGRWDWSRLGGPALVDRALAATEAVLVALGAPLGEEIVLRARKPWPGSFARPPCPPSE